MGLRRCPYLRRGVVASWGRTASVGRVHHGGGRCPNPFCARASPASVVERIEGRASPDGTRRFRERAHHAHAIPLEHFRTAPGDLFLSSFGLGTYIGSPDGATDVAVEQAAGICLTSHRVNVIDSAINYRYQWAERSVGRAVARAIAAGTLQRDEVFLSTKIGYLAPDAESGEPIDGWVDRHLIHAGVLRPSEIVDGSHAMSVDYLADQLTRSRQNLGVATIDLLYLHNAADAQLPVVGREEFFTRLEHAFAFLEAQRASGAITTFGLATWDCLRARRGDPTYVSLESLVTLARRVGGPSHGFRFVQFPFNVGMPEALILRNQVVGGERMTLFEAARRLEVGCFTSVPLFQGQLADSGLAAEGLTSAQSALQFARSAPGSLGPMVGQKSPEHLSENLALAETAVWSPAAVTEFLG